MRRQQRPREKERRGTSRTTSSRGERLCYEKTKKKPKWEGRGIRMSSLAWRSLFYLPPPAEFGPVACLHGLRLPSPAFRLSVAWKRTDHPREHKQTRDLMRLPFSNSDALYTRDIPTFIPVPPPSFSPPSTPPPWLKQRQVCVSGVVVPVRWLNRA